ncbi:MAG: DUF3375 family protein [Streptosporangiaceae bacterium]|jgi:hypothetical protein
MSDIAGELARVREAFEKPTLRLLDRKWAPLVLAVFKSSFSRDQRSVAAERLHTQVDTYFDELRSVGVQVPSLQGRALCLEWMNDQWLFRTIGDRGQEEYSLTSHALEALDLVQALSRERALISESRLNTILDAVRRWATEANPDRQARTERLDMQIRQLTSERDRLAAGGDVAAATDDRMLDGYANLVDLIGQLPSDFKRVEESVLGMHRQIISDFRGEERPISQVLDEYLAKTDELTTLTPEGRAFEGAFTLLRDAALLLDLKSDLQMILEHPFALALTAAEQRDFLGTVAIIRRGIDDVLAQRSRLTTTLRDHIVNHDIVRDRELDATLRQINQQLAIWMETAGARAAVPVTMIPPQIDVEHLRERFWDPANEVPPPPLDDVSDTAPEPPNLDDIRTQGGPSLLRLRRSLLAALEAGDSDTVGEMFNALPADLRRPVEILGLVHLLASGNLGRATRAGEYAHEDALDGDPNSGLASAATAEVFDAIRPDGTRRQFLVPRLELSLADARNSAILDEGTRA